MSVSWLSPAASLGLASLAIPILIHLLARERRRRFWFPSLKFLQTSRVAALKQRRISDLPLLAIRLLILAFAVAALASPVFVSDVRWRLWNTRIARAVVVAPTPRGAVSDNAEMMALVRDTRSGAFASEVFHPSETIADGLRDAATWLAQQPPAVQEVVVVGDLRVGALTGTDLDQLTPATGIRLLPDASSQPMRDVRLRATADAAGGAVESQEVHLLLTDQATTIERRTAAMSGPDITVIAAPQDQQRADAALRAVLGEGVVLPREEDRRIVVEFVGSPDGQSLEQPASEIWMRRVLEALPGMDGGARGGQLVVRPGLVAADRNVAPVLAQVAAAALADDLSDLEPSRIPANLLAQWSRPSGPVPRDAVPGDEGDRRYFWAAAVTLLLLEQWLRRSRASTPEVSKSVDGPEVRVA